MSLFAYGRGLALAGAALTFASTMSPALAVDPLRITWVSHTGTDSGTCQPNAPCRTFQYAHDQMTQGGSIYALDTIADFGPLTITRGLAIYSPDESSATRAKIHVEAGNAITVNAGPNDTIVLVNLRLEGAGSGNSNNGILFNSGRALEVYDGTIVGFNAAAPNGFGIKFAPSSLGKLVVQGTYLGFNGSGSTGGGLQVNPKPGGAAQILLDRVKALNGVFGVAVDTTGSSSGVNGVIRNSELLNNSQDGLVLVGGAPIGVLIDHSAVFANGGKGVRAIGANVVARLTQTAVAGNVTGVAALSGGTVQSYGNNNIVANATNGVAAKVPTD